MNKIAVTAQDLDACASEPIRIPGGIQPHGALAAVDPDSFGILQASANLRSMLGVEIAPGGSFAATLGASLCAELAAWRDGDAGVLLRTVSLGNGHFQLSGHRSRQGLLLEFEAAPVDDRDTLAAAYPRLRAFVEAVGDTRTVHEIAQLAVDELRVLTGFDRILLYSFDTQGDGTVLAESTNGVLPSYLDLRFPAADIPSQARALYRSNRLRLIPNASYTPAAIEPLLSPLDGRPLDLSQAALRSVSPIHLEYMRNMQTGASMSLSVLVDGELWGLISCHNREPKAVNAQIRSACDFLGQIVSMQIGSRERAERAARRIALKVIEGELLARMSQSNDFHQGIDASGDAWLRVVAADGLAVVTPEGMTLIGSTPSKPEIRQLSAWLQQGPKGEVYATDQLSAHWPQGEAFANVASGLLAVSISQLHASYIMWFRQELVRTVRWGGDPRRDSTADRLHPRKSFDVWKEQVRAKSIAWNDVETAAAHDLRNSIVNVVLRRAEERAALSEQLQKSNAELQAFSYSVSHDLRAPFRHIVGYADLLRHREKDLDEKSQHYVASIVESAVHAGRLVDDLLAFSQVGRASLTLMRVDMRKLVAEVTLSAAPDIKDRDIEWQIGDLPPTDGDASLLRQVWGNLIDNAIKYTGKRARAVITISGSAGPDGARYSVTDNGVGFDMDYAGKLFNVFQRLHRAEQFPGTGIGLALAKRIVERHGGSVWATGELDKGATIGFTIPPNSKEILHGGP